MSCVPFASFDYGLFFYSAPWPSILPRLPLVLTDVADARRTPGQSVTPQTSAVCYTCGWTWHKLTDGRGKSQEVARTVPTWTNGSENSWQNLKSKFLLNPKHHWCKGHCTVYAIIVVLKLDIQVLCSKVDVTDYDEEITFTTLSIALFRFQPNMCNVHVYVMLNTCPQTKEPLLTRCKMVQANTATARGDVE